MGLSQTRLSLSSGSVFTSSTNYDESIRDLQKINNFISKYSKIDISSKSDQLIFNSKPSGFIN